MATEDAMTLFRRAKVGSREAFEVLIEGLRARLLSWIDSRIQARLRRDLDPEDVLQETFLKAFRSLSSIEWQGEAAFLAWLRGIAENHIRSEARKHLRVEKVDLEPELPASMPSPSKGLQRTERFDRLKGALDSLPPDYREAIVLARIRGLPVRQIAERLGRTEGATMQLLSRALKRLREALEPDTGSLRLPARSLDETGECDG